LAGCKKNDIHNTDDQVGISRVTHFPTLELKGDQYMAIPAGSTFTDPGITAKEGSNDIPYTTSGSVNSNNTGVYILTYSAVNKDGFAASVTRTVAVYSTDDVAASNDLSGTYVRTSNNVSSTWTRIAPGVYTVVNPGGAPGFTTTVIVFNSTGFTIHIPSQTIDDGSTMTSSDEVYTANAPVKYVWKILNPAYGTALRTFVKQ
jgi:hypothetical protein